MIIYGCYNGRSRGAQGALSAQRALRGALCTSAPKIGAHSTSLISTNGSNRPNSPTWHRLVVWTVGALVAGIRSKSRV